MKTAIYQALDNSKNDMISKIIFIYFDNHRIKTYGKQSKVGNLAYFGLILNQITISAEMQIIEINYCWKSNRVTGSINS
jgi:hypothetical protein